MKNMETLHRILDSWRDKKGLDVPASIQTDLREAFNRILPLSSFVEPKLISEVPQNGLYLICAVDPSWNHKDIDLLITLEHFVEQYSSSHAIAVVNLACYSELDPIKAFIPIEAINPSPPLVAVWEYGVLKYCGCGLNAHKKVIDLLENRVDSLNL